MMSVRLHARKAGGTAAWPPLGAPTARRRLRRAALSAASVAITVTMLVAVLAFRATVDQRRFGGGSALVDPVASRDTQVLLVITVMLVVLAAVNAVLIAWATALDARFASALARALGVSPRQVAAGLSAAQLFSALPGALIGIPLGIGLFRVANHAALTTIPPASWLACVLLGTVVVVAGLASVPARLAAHRPVAGILQRGLT